MEEPGNMSGDTEFWARGRRHLLKYGGEFVDFVPVRAEGAFLYDAAGRRVLDFTSGQMSAVLGHSHPEIVATVRDGIGRLDHLFSELKAHAAAENCTPAQFALAWLLSRAPDIVPIPGTSHRHRIEENATAATIKVSADTEDALLQVFAPGAASWLRYPEHHLPRLGI